MLREESEGYAKLIVLLNGFRRGRMTDASVADVASHVQALTGYFRLDPNRVVDVVLAAFERQPDNAAFVRLLAHPMFRKSTVPQVLGVRLRRLARADQERFGKPEGGDAKEGRGDKDDKDARGKDPPARSARGPGEAGEGAAPGAPRPAVQSASGRAAVRVAARLVAGGLLAVEDVYPHLAPSDEEMVERHARARAAAKARSAGKLGGFSGLDAAKRHGAVDLSATEVVVAALSEMPPCDQKAALVADLLDLGELARASGVLRRLHGIKVQLMMWPEVRDAGAPRPAPPPAPRPRRPARGAPPMPPRPPRARRWPTGCASAWRRPRGR